MKSWKIIVISVLTLGYLYPVAQSQEYFVDPGAVLTHFEGWGTSLAWFGDVLGGMDQDIINEITSALFSPDRLNLNILRYTIGGTTPGDYRCGDYRWGGATESFKDGPDIPYNWNRDPRARAILLAAQRLGVDVFEAFSNSPPQWMTISGCSKGNEGGGSQHVNFDPVNADIFADYLTEVVKHYHDNWGVTFTSLAPFNEPSSGYWNGWNSGQEGCNFDWPGMVAVVRSLDASLRQKNMSYVELSPADETNVNQEVATQNHFRDQGLQNLYTKVNVHGYGNPNGDRRDYLYMISQRDGHVLWMDEMGWGASPINDMTQGFSVANRIVFDMRNLVPSAWVYWQAMEDQVPGAWGLVDIPYANPSLSSIRFTSGYYAMLQFSKYIRKGSDIIHVNNENALASHDISTNTLVLVIVNDGGNDRSETYDFSLFSSLGSVQATRTSSSEQNVEIQGPVINNKKLQYTAPRQSVTTIVISGAVRESIQNVVANAEFELGDNDPWPWILLYGNEGGANQDYARRGKSGFIKTRSSDTSLIQFMTAPQTKTYYLTAWCASSGSGAKVGVLINGNQGPELNIIGNAGYKVYGLSFQANQGDGIAVYLYALQDNSDSYIDDVILH